MKIEERYKIWQELLRRPQGATNKEVNQRIYELTTVPEDYYDLIRKDKENIQKLLKTNGYKLLETTRGKEKCYRIEDDVDIVKMHIQSKIAQPYLAILDLLSHCQGILPEQFLKSLCSVYADLSDNEEKKKYISFEASYDDYHHDLECLPTIYNALNKYPLYICMHKVNQKENSFDMILHPEYLKQYRSNWYVFGVLHEMDAQNINKTPQKIALSTIDDYREITDMPFIHSDVTDYEDYFYDIVGVENIPNVEPEMIKFRISNKMFNRMWNTPFHHSLRKCPELDIKGFKGMYVKMKYNIELIRVFLNYGSDLEVVSPSHIRKKVIAEYKKCMKKYQ